MARQKNYHHGDLRQALLEAGLAMLEEVGLEGISLRKIAARVGVSHAAPEHHFPTLKHLLNAMAGEGFRLFESAMRREMAATEPSPAPQMRAAFSGYLAFATAHPHLFRLMFNANLLDWSDPALAQAGAPGLAVLGEISRPVAIRLGLDTEIGRASVEQLVWSQVHGHAHLVIDDKLPINGAPTGPAPGSGLDLAAFLLPD
jgi:AcrR family transcriptional regulator